MALRWPPPPIPNPSTHVATANLAICLLLWLFPFASHNSPLPCCTTAPPLFLRRRRRGGNINPTRLCLCSRLCGFGSLLCGSFASFTCCLFSQGMRMQGGPHIWECQHQLQDALHCDMHLCGQGLCERQLKGGADKGGRPVEVPHLSSSKRLCDTVAALGVIFFQVCDGSQGRHLSTFPLSSLFVLPAGGLILTRRETLL
mmetsp:Transcript_3703/g.10016  ORF Transcript_3703/g.10016 Transcript_3703/m.10016 type:complete len:200 (-) Transcript_3703:1455-2054(-)